MPAKGTSERAYTQPHDHLCGLLLEPPPRLFREVMPPGSDRSIIFVRSNNVSKPVVVVSEIFRAGKRPREAGSSLAAAGDVVGVQSIASSSSSSRDCDCSVGAGADDALGDGGLKVAGLSEG